VEDEKAFDRFTKNAGEHLELENKGAKTSFVDIARTTGLSPSP